MRGIVPSIKPFTRIVLTSVLGIPLIFSGFVKMLNPSDFAAALVYSFSFPKPVGILVATLLPPIEFVLGLFLFVGGYTKIALRELEF